MFKNGGPDYSHVSAYVAATGETVNIPDVYNAYGFDFAGTRSFDAETGYRSQSMLVVPMRNHENDIIGVLQLLNAKDPGTGQVVAFSENAQSLAVSLASQAAVALTNNMLIANLQNLLDAFIETIATTIDEKSPYTGGHVRRVADLTMMIAGKINECSEGPFAHVCFSADEMKELNMAAWLHDIGKITTPEHIIDKSTKLEKVCDRIGNIKTRFELIKREYQQNVPENRQNGCTCTNGEIKGRFQGLEEERLFLESINSGREFTDNEMIERIKRISKRQWIMSDQTLPLLSEDEIHNLSIRQGTLNEEERAIINNHAAMTYKMLSRLPFPRKLRKIATYASAHHERIDGSGYPLGLKGDDLPIQARIIAMADIFEALTAQDRPYKEAKMLSEVVRIMEQMVRDHHLDADIFALFMKEKIYLKYAERELAPRQMDMP